MRRDRDRTSLTDTIGLSAAPPAPFCSNRTTGEAIKMQPGQSASAQPSSGPRPMSNVSCPLSHSTNSQVTGPAAGGPRMYSLHMGLCHLLISQSDCSAVSTCPYAHIHWTHQGVPRPELSPSPALPSLPSPPLPSPRPVLLTISWKTPSPADARVTPPLTPPLPSPPLPCPPAGRLCRPTAGDPPARSDARNRRAER